jgi:hypothetical protein
MTSPLDEVRIASPCRANWDEMRGDDRVRFCSMCKLNVYDVSNMRERDALALIAKSEGGRVCVRLWRRRDGTVITSDCPEGRAARARRRAKTLVAGLVSLVIVALGGKVFAATEPGQRLARRFATWFEPESKATPRPEPPCRDRRVMMGAIVAPAPGTVTK